MGFFSGSDRSRALLFCSILTRPFAGGVSIKGAVNVFGHDSGGGRASASTVTVCAYTDEGVIHRVALRRPAAAPGGKVRWGWGGGLV